MISYADLSRILPFTTDRALAENLGFILLNVFGRVLELLGYITVTLIWLRTLANANQQSIEASQQQFWVSSLSPVFVLFTLLLVVASVSVSVVVFLQYPHASRDKVLATPLSLLQMLLEAVCWGIHGIIAGLCAAMTSKFILRMVSGTGWTRQVHLLAKAVLPMIVACLGYLTRCVWLIVAYFDDGTIRDTWAWWIGFIWIPTVFVTLALLYSVRKRDTFDGIQYQQQTNNDSSSASDSDDLERPLLSQPPEEAFRAFSRLRQNLNNDDDTCDGSLILASPMPHIYAKRPLPDAQEDADEERGGERDEDASTLTIDESQRNNNTGGILI
ncbi:MAG: hypothetical protein SGARI_003769 [Bacillariaceae sp.]